MDGTLTLAMGPHRATTRRFDDPDERGDLLVDRRGVADTTSLCESAWADAGKVIARLSVGIVLRPHAHLARFVDAVGSVGMPPSVVLLAGTRFVAIRVAIQHFYDQTPGQKAGTAL